MTNLITGLFEAVKVGDKQAARMAYRKLTNLSLDVVFPEVDKLLKQYGPQG